MAIQIKNLRKSYNKRKVFHGFNLEVSTGKIKVIRGENGIGKTTLMHCIAGIEDFGGKIEKEGELSYLFQDARLLPWMNIRRNILMPIKLQGEEIRDRHVKRMEKLAEELSVKEHLSKKVGEVSGGQKQKAMQIRALINNPDVLLLDEPFQSHDNQTRMESYENIFSICREEGNTVLVSSHRRDMEKVVDETVNLKGRKGVVNS